MRFYLMTILCVLALGCNSDPNCRRETALLRSEILDLEDKYYLLKSERDSLLQGQGVQGIQGAPVNRIYDAGQPVYQEPIYQEPIYQEPIYQRPLSQGQVLGNEIGYSGGQAYYVDTGEPYLGERAYDTGYQAGYYDDPDIVYDHEIGYGNQGHINHHFDQPVIHHYDEPVVQSYDDPIEHGYVDQSDQGYASEILKLGKSRQPTLAKAPVQLEPDDSILPLYSGQSDSEDFDQYPEDFDLDAPELEINSPQSTQNDELQILLEAPAELEVGYDKKTRTKEITEVVINRLATQGHDIDGVPGDEGLDLLIQPRSADGEVQLVSGELTVSVIDPTRSSDKQRIGLWKFLESETELFFANNELGSYGILLHLPWDQETPVNEQLTVHIRFISPAGKEFETSTQILIDPPQPNYSPNDPLVTGWTRSDKRWDTGISSSPARKRSTSSDPDWIRRQKTSPVRAQVRTPSQTGRRRARAIPAKAIIEKANIEKPAWRPSR